MDIQFVIDAYSCVMYIITYLSKAECQMGLLLDRTQMEGLNGNLDAKQPFKKLGCAHLHNREVT